MKVWMVSWDRGEFDSYDAVHSIWQTEELAIQEAERLRCFFWEEKKKRFSSRRLLVDLHPDRCWEAEQVKVMEYELNSGEVEL